MRHSNRRLSTAATLLAAALTAVPIQAAAGIDPGAYTVRTLDVPIPSDSPGLGGARVPCGPGLRVVTGGAFFHVPGDGPDPSLEAYLSSSAPTRDSKAWFAAGISWEQTDLLLRIVAYCLPSEAVGAYNVKTSEVRPVHDEYAVIDQRCPGGQRLVSGGGFWHRPGAKTSTDVEGYLRSSAPDSDALGWYGVGLNDDTDPYFTVIALCRAATAVGAYSIHRLDVTVGAFQTGGGSVTCPTGSRVVPGGAWWHRPVQTRDPGLEAYLRGSLPRDGGRRWYAGGPNAEDSALQLRIIAFCRAT